VERVCTRGQDEGAPGLQRPTAEAGLLVEKLHQAGVLRPPILEVVEGRPYLLDGDSTLLFPRIQSRLHGVGAERILCGSPAAAASRFRHRFSTVFWPQMALADARSWEVAGDLLEEGGGLILRLRTPGVGIRTPSNWRRGPRVQRSGELIVMWWKAGGAARAA
jgi:hypothetical protein